MLASIMSWIIGLLTSWYIWMPIVAVLAFLTYRNYKRANFIEAGDYTLLILEIPKANDKKELAAEQMFASLHGILRDRKELSMTGGFQEHISFEIASIGKHIRFYVWVPKHLQNFLEGQIYAQYPTVQIHEAEEDYAKRDVAQPVSFSAELSLIENEVLPIKTFQSFEVDPLAGITATLAKLEQSNEEMWIQVMARPIADDWHRRSQRYVNSVKNGGGMAGEDIINNLGLYFIRAIEALWKPPESGPGSSGGPKELSERVKTRINEAETKSTKLGYQVKIRMLYLGNDESIAKQRMQAIVGTFKQYNSTNLNGFAMRKMSFDRNKIAEYAARLFIDKGYILNIEELASVYHLPHTSVETPNIVWASSKTAEPPATLPVITGTDKDEDSQISAFGLTNFRGINHQFGLYRMDRSRHVYVIGQTGAGKSGLLELFALSDIFHNQGYAIIDPHGDLAVNNMRFIPEHRIKDVVYFNPADTAHPIGFNPMEVIDPNMKNNISSEIIGVLKRMFVDSWGPRLEYILRYTILALLDYPGSTMLDITRMLTDKKFREEVLTHVDDTVVLNFWKIEFASWNDKFASEAVAPVLNKVGAFTANPIIRNIIGQPKSTFNIREIMDEGKILIVNLSKGLIGEDNAAILGSFIVTKVQLAAMSRADIPRIEDRRPFFLYVDEFQNFATDSFATILSEARKYGLNLTVANQYISQMSDTVRDAVFGNVGTTISFRVSADDAPLLSKQFEPQFEAADILQMHNRHFVTSMVIKGEKVPAFSATTLMLPPPQTDYTSYIIENTRRHYSSNRSEVEESIRGAISPPQHLQSKQPQQSQSMAKKWPIDKGARAVNQQPQRQSQSPAPKPRTEASTAATVAPAPLPPSPTPTSAQSTAAQPKELLEPTDKPSQIPAHTPATAEGSNDTAAPKKKRSRSRSRNRNKQAQASNDNPETSSTPNAHEQAQREQRRAEKPAEQPPRPQQSSSEPQPLNNDTHELRLR